MWLKRFLADESGMILRSVIKWGIIAVVIAIIVVEVGPLIWIRIFSVQNVDDVASAAASEYSLNHDEEEARKSAAEKLRLMGYSEKEIEECVVQFLPAGNVPKQSVRVTVVRYANTLITKHIKQIEKYARVSTTKEVSIGGTQ